MEGCGNRRSQIITPTIPTFTERLLCLRDWACFVLEDPPKNSWLKGYLPHLIGGKNHRISTCVGLSWVGIPLPHAMKLNRSRKPLLYFFPPACLQIKYEVKKDTFRYQRLTLLLEDMKKAHRAANQGLEYFFVPFRNCQWNAVSNAGSLCFPKGPHTGFPFTPKFPWLLECLWACVWGLEKNSFPEIYQVVDFMSLSVIYLLESQAFGDTEKTVQQIWVRAPLRDGKFSFGSPW